MPQSIVSKIERSGFVCRQYIHCTVHKWPITVSLSQAKIAQAVIDPSYFHDYLSFTSFPFGIAATSVAAASIPAHLHNNNNNNCSSLFFGILSIHNKTIANSMIGIHSSRDDGITEYKTFKSSQNVIDRYIECFQ